MEATNNAEQNKLQLDESELAHLKKQTGIEDVDELTKHVQDVVRRAHEVFGYKYLTSTLFLKSKLARLPVYKHVLEVGKTRKDALFLDLGCGLGHDTRRAASDGYPVQNLIASDLYPEFWTLGHELFKSTPESFPVPFIPGDAFNNDFIPDRKPFMENPNTPRPSMDSLVSSKSLAGLQGHLSFIHASALFHLFREEPQRQLAKKFASLLSPVPGSVIFGLHRGSPEPREKTNHRGETIFCHSPESFKRVWTGGEGEEGVFPPGSVEVEVVPFQIDRLGEEYYLLVWSVKRI
ncbi:hypothetical protein K435DRAFT_748703 [Dendrothele bispora CBS 962.96]|uniref:Methyltransferase domain-containing protein n=1 Tax=Dendrothele bispora (strain CBS 962.96) TaxID=1314807 RepID=A0A4S8MKS7_DENBC|nr:hypothetical protein K435DRAFT_748703 [Dendrothele bispora CBS 962.96]